MDTIESHKSIWKPLKYKKRSKKYIIIRYKTNGKIWNNSSIFSTKIDKCTPFWKTNFERFEHWSQKSLWKSLQWKKLGEAHQIFFKFQRKCPYFQKTNVEKSTFCNMRFKGVHRFNTLKIRIFHDDSIAKDFSWIAPLVFEKIPFYLSKSCGLRPQIYISMQKKSY